ncbi:MAG: hypothetical protein ABJF10_04240 [Chthoniobacter sp.]|uniref:hypothetical protein n=1 Tax=Chthoniobacter sp. TaxID=2510640 RepID=UPI0032AD40DD
MYRGFVVFLTACWTASAGWAADAATIKCPSPDGRFVLRIADQSGVEPSNPKVTLIEKESGRVMVELGEAYPSHLGDTVLVWSANSKWAAYGTRGDKEGEASVYFWNGSAFVEVTLPEELPRPDIKFGKGAGEDVKNYGGAARPVRWLKSGELQMSSDLMMLSRVNSKSYTGEVTFTLAFDKRHHASVHKVGKSKTTVDD